jgi:arsenate reductase-like glutaredoxin family protein
MQIKIFWQPECPKCPEAKELGEVLKKEGYEVELFNIKEIDGLAESVFYDVLSTPSVVVVENGERKAAWFGEVPDVESIKDLL